MCYCGESNNDFDWSCTRKARKVHWCCECRSDIAIGEVYVEMTVGSDGSVSRYRMCVACDADREVFQKLARLTSCGSFCWVFGGMDECAKELIEEAEYEIRNAKRRSPTVLEMMGLRGPERVIVPEEAEPLVGASKERLEAARERHRAAMARVKRTDDAVLSLGS